MDAPSTKQVGFRVREGKFCRSLEDFSTVQLQMGYSGVDQLEKLFEVLEATFSFFTCTRWVSYI